MTQSGNQHIQSTLKGSKLLLPATFSVAAHQQRAAVRGDVASGPKDDPLGFWGEMAGNLELVPPLGHCDAGAHARYEMVRRRKNQRQL